MASEQEDYSATRDNILNDFIDLKEQLNVWVLRAQSDLRDLGALGRYSRADAARLAWCGEQAIKDAVASGKLKTGGSNYITLPQLTDWLGCDPIRHRLDLIIELNKKILDITSIIDSLFDSPIPNHLIPSDSMTNIEPAA